MHTALPSSFIKESCKGVRVDGAVSHRDYRDRVRSSLIPCLDGITGFLVSIPGIKANARAGLQVANKGGKRGQLR